MHTNKPRRKALSSEMKGGSESTKGKAVLCSPHRQPAGGRLRRAPDRSALVGVSIGMFRGVPPPLCGTKETMACRQSRHGVCIISLEPRAPEHLFASPLCEAKKATAFPIGTKSGQEPANLIGRPGLVRLRVVRVDVHQLKQQPLALPQRPGCVRTTQPSRVDQHGAIGNGYSTRARACMITSPTARLCQTKTKSGAASAAVGALASLHVCFSYNVGCSTCWLLFMLAALYVGFFVCWLLNMLADNNSHNSSNNN